MRAHFLQRAFAAVLLVPLSPIIVDAPLSGQNATGLPSPPEVHSDFMHPVGKGYDVMLGPIEIVTGNEFSAEARREGGPGPATKTTRYWFKSPLGVIRYHSADHTRIIWEGRYENLKLAAILSENSDGKDQVDIPIGSIWVSSVSIENPPQPRAVMGSSIPLPKLVAGFWNPGAIHAEYNPKGEVSSQVGSVRFVSSQSVKLLSAKLSMPSCQLEAALDFKSVQQSETTFDFALGDSELVLHGGRFVSPALVSSTPVRVNCTDFHTALSSLRTGLIAADISPTDIKFKSSIADASGSFLARIGQMALPVIGRGRLSTVSIESSSLRKAESASIDQLSIAGLQYSSAATPSVGNFRRVANEIGSALALPDFLSPEQQQLKAIDDTATSLTRLSSAGADVLVHIPATEVKFFTDKKLKDAGIQKIISFGFGKQEILAFIPASSANSPISLVLHLAISTGDTYVSIRPSISFAALSSLNSALMGAGKRTPEQIAVFLEKQLAPITKPLTTFDTEIKVPIPTNNVCNLDLTKPIIDEATKAVIDVKAASTTISVSAPEKAILIDPDGLHVMVHVDLDLKRTNNNAPTC